MILKLTISKNLFQRVFKTDPRSFPFLTPPPPFNVAISRALNGRHTEKSHATFAGDSSIERRPTLIRVRGNLSTYLPYSETAKAFFGLNVLVVFKISQCEHNLNFGKKKQYAIGQI